MIKQPSLKCSLVMFILSFMFLASCNQSEADNNKSTSVLPDSSLFAPVLDSISLVTKPNAIEGKLYTLYAEKKYFENLSITRKIIFSFTFDANDILKMDGWVATNATGTDIADTPSIFLLPGKETDEDYKQGTYLGNLIIRVRDQNIKKIKDAIIAQNASYVVFVPSYLGDNKHLIYAIYVSQTDPRTFTLTDIKKFATPVGVNLNPSPPREY